MAKNKDMSTQDASPFLFGGSTGAPGAGIARSASVSGQASVPGSGASGIPGVPGSGEVGAPGAGATSLPGRAEASVPGQSEAAQQSPAVFAQMQAAGEVADFLQMEGSRKASDPRMRTIAILVVATIVLIPLTLILPTHLFDYAGFDSSSAQLASSLSGRLQAVGEIFTGTAAGKAMAIYFWQVLAVAIAGAGLALNGAVYQGALKNALASPSTLGVMSGATLGAVLYTLFRLLPEQNSGEAFVRVSELASYLDSLGPLEYFLATQERVLWSLVGSLIVVALVLVIAFVAGKGAVSKVGLLISGQVFAAVITSIIEMIRYYLSQFGTDAEIQALRNVVSGGFDTITGPYPVVLLAIPVVLAIVIIMVLRSRLNLLSFGDEEAKSLGMRVNFTRNLAVIVCTVLTAVIVAFCGTVGFVGFLVPHVARKLVGPDTRYLIPASIFLGSSYLLVAYYLMNMTNFLSGSVGTFTSLLGAILFMIIAIRQRARGNVDWV